MNDETPLVGSARYLEWHAVRARPLALYMTRAILDLSPEDVRRLPARGAVLINLADVAYENTNQATVSIHVGHDDCKESSTWQECRERVFTFEGMTSEWISALEIGDVAATGWVASNQSAAALVALCDVELRAAAIVYALLRDPVTLVRRVMESRRLSLASCS